MRCQKPSEVPGFLEFPRSWKSMSICTNWVTLEHQSKEHHTACLIAVWYRLIKQLAYHIDTYVDMIYVNIFLRNPTEVDSILQPAWWYERDVWEVPFTSLNPGRVGSLKGRSAWSHAMVTLSCFLISPEMMPPGMKPTSIFFLTRYLSDVNTLRSLLTKAH